MKTDARTGSKNLSKHSTGVRIRQMTRADIPSVARLHQTELSGFLSQLGEEFLKTFYEASDMVPDIFTLVAEEKGQILGVVLATTNTKDLYKKILRIKYIRCISLILRHILTHPVHTIQMVKMIKYPGFDGEKPELMTLAVDKNYRLKGIGISLLRACAGEFAKRGVSSFLISIYDHLPANRFYQHIGCQKLTTFSFLGKAMNYYRYAIGKNEAASRNL